MRGAGPAVVLLSVVIATANAASAACGKKGPPLAPLRLVPAAVSEMDARRAGASVELRFGLPAQNANGPGPVDLERVEVYAVTLPAGAAEPANRDLLTRTRVVGTIAVKSPPVEGEATTPAAAADTRPAAGERVRFVEELTEEKLRAASAPAPPAAPSGGEARPADAAAGTSPVPVRVYAVRGISRDGRPGLPARVKVPLVEPPLPPASVMADFSERAITLGWIPPVAMPEGPSIAFNVYPADLGGGPINGAPITDPTFEQPIASFGQEQCFVVRSVSVVLGVSIESASSEKTCTTPQDKFPPAPPTGLQAVPTAEGISLSWDASPAADLSGYVLLRGEAPGATLQPLTREPIRETTYRDTTVTPGVSYVYAVVALDKATPPNASAQSAPQAATAR